MSKVIIFTNNNGGVSVCFPTGEIPIEQVKKEHIPVGVESFIIDKQTLPDINYFFDAWEQLNGVISINFEKAKNITKNRLRIERAELLQQQDIAFQRALENGQPTDQIVAEKQRLRDLPLLADSCTTLDELRSLKP